jgi:hypothetical protein
MGYRFNPPPNWPAPPPGWVPPPGWQPPSEWPAPPPGWQVWVDDAASVPGADESVQASLPRQPGPRHARGGTPGSNSASPVAPPAIPVVTAASPETLTAGSAGARRDDRVGIFGAHKRAEALRQENSHLARARDALAAENERLRQRVTGLLGMSTDELAAEADRVRHRCRLLSSRSARI